MQVASTPLMKVEFITYEAPLIIWLRSVVAWKKYCLLLNSCGLIQILCFEQQNKNHAQIHIATDYP